MVMGNGGLAHQGHDAVPDAQVSDLWWSSSSIEEETILDAVVKRGGRVHIVWVQGL
jgi:hypothetical protein